MYNDVHAPPPHQTLQTVQPYTFHKSTMSPPEEAQLNSIVNKRQQEVHCFHRIQLFLPLLTVAVVTPI